MSRAAKILIALIMAFTASALHARVVVVVSGAGDAVMEIARDSADGRAADTATHRCASSTGSPTNARSSCPFETGARTEPYSLSGRTGQQNFPVCMVPVYSERTDDPDHGPPKLLS